MKVFALVLLCIVAAAQARSSAVLTSSRAVAEAGANPWIVHLRIAIGTSGFLKTCVGSLIDERWVLTAAECLTDVRFIWIRYGAINVINPELVTENSLVQFHPTANVGLININRVVHSTANIAPVALASSAEAVDSTTFCAYGEENGAPGEVLNCFTVALNLEEDTYIADSDDGKATRFDLGAPLVVNGEQIGILTEASDDNAGTFLSIASVLEWIADRA